MSTIQKALLKIRSHSRRHLKHPVNFRHHVVAINNNGECLPNRPCPGPGPPTNFDKASADSEARGFFLGKNSPSPGFSPPQLHPNKTPTPTSSLVRLSFEDCLSEDTRGFIISRQIRRLCFHAEPGFNYVLVLSSIVSIAFRFIDLFFHLATLSLDPTVFSESQEASKYTRLTFNTRKYTRSPYISDTLPSPSINHPTWRIN
jgi:hypothetical protein